MAAERTPMRMVFGEHLARLGDADSRIVVLDADTSTSTQTAIFAARHPERFINCGIAEANMVSVAAGIATTGLRPVVSAFAVLLALRAGDQIRAQVAYTGLPVVLVGGYAGLSDFADGGSHQSIEDLATFLAMPNLTVVCPGDATETELALEAALRSDGPVFLRLSRAEVGRLDLPGQFEVGRAVIRRQGGDVAILATGQMLEPAMHAAVMLAAEGIEARLIDLHTVKPLDEQAILDAACECGCLITCEEHNVIGGVGSRVASLLAARQPTPLRMVGISDEYGQSGAYDALREHYGLTAHRVVATARELLARVNTEQGGVALRAGTIQ